VRLGADGNDSHFGVPDRAAAAKYAAIDQLIIGLDTQLSDSILIRVEAHPGVYNNGGSTICRTISTCPFVIGGTSIYSPDLQIVLARVDVERSIQLFPVAGVRWQMARQWVLNAVLPTPRLESR